MRKVRITGLPKKQNGGGQQTEATGIRRFMDSTRTYDSDLNPFAAPDVEVNRTLQPVDRSQANIEAEKGEVAMVPGMGGIPETYIVGGNRHSNGGTPLNLSEDSFIWSDNKANKYGMKIKDKELLKDEFGMSVPKKGRFKGYTPAEIAKKYDINKYKKVLMDPNSDKIERETAEMMIENYNLKLGKLALVQESMKGFPTGAPKAAEGYMNQVGMDPQMFNPQQQQMPPQMAAYGAGVIGDVSQYAYQGGGEAAGYRNELGEFLPYPKYTDIDDSARPRQERPGMTLRPGQYGEANWFDLDYDGQNISVPGGRNFFESARLARNINRRIRDNDLDFKRVKLGAFKQDDTGGTYTFQRGGEYEGAFWNSIMQEGGENLTLKERMQNARYDRYMRRHPDIEWTPVPEETPVVDPVVEAAAAAETTPVDPTATSVVDETKPVASKKPTYTYNVPDKYRDNDMYNTESDTYDPTAIKEGDYIKRADGKWYKATGLQPIHGTYTGDDMATTFGGNADVAGAYAYLQDTFEDPDVRKAYADQTRAALRNKEYYKGKSGGYSEMYSEEEISRLTDDDLVDLFLKHQKRNYSLQANGVDPEDFQDANGNLRSASDLARVMGQRKKADGTLAYPTPEAARAEADRRIANYQQQGIESLNSAFDNFGIGISDEELSAGELGLQQASYWGYHNLIGDRDNLDPELKDKLKYLTEPQEGFGDEPLNATISPIDSKSKNFYTNTTAGQLSVVEGEEMGFDEADLMDKDRDPIEPGKPEVSRQGDPAAQVWAQDVMNMGNLVQTALSRKKYLPHSYPVDIGNPDVLYYDPARAVATTNEQSGMARRANTAFAGPNSTYRNSAIAGKTWAKNLDTIGQYDNMNVPIGNQYYDKVYEADRFETMANADRAQRLYDGWTIANQQFDNTKVADRRNITDAKIQMLTNAMETQAWNQQFPNFNTHPGVGGGMWRSGYNRPFVNTGMPGQSNSYVAQFQQLKQQYPEASDRAIENQLGMQYGMPLQRRAPSPYDQQRAEQAAFAAQYGAINPLGNYGG
jgi:hypothetical protein